MTVLASTPVAIVRNVGGFVFDAWLREDHTHEAEITDEPLETGESASDHAYMKPYKLQISVGVGDVLLGDSSNDDYAGARAMNAMSLLTSLQESFEPFSVQTGLMLYENMLIEKLRPSQDKDTAGSFICDLELKSVKIVSTASISYPPRRSGTTTHQASAQTNNGQQQGEQQTDNGKKSSLAASFLKFMRGN